MAAGFKFDIRVDRREMDAALKRLYVFSKWAPAKLVNHAAYRSNQKAVWYAPTVKKETIATELNAASTLTLIKSGKRFRRQNTARTASFGNLGNLARVAKNAGVPLLALIIQSRAPKHPSPWKGVSRAQGAAAMLEKMRRILGARQKSRAYFKACFATVRDAFKRAAGGKIPFSDEKSRGSGTVASMRRDLGRIAKVKPATKAQGFKALATFEIISPRHDLEGAIYKHAAPALQRGMDEEAAFLLKKSYELELRNFCKAAGIRTAG